MQKFPESNSRIQVISKGIEGLEEGWAYVLSL